MNLTSRRAVLSSVAVAAAGLPLLNDLAGNGRTAVAAETAERFATNTALYSSGDFKEGTNWMRRFRCGTPGGLLDNDNNTSTAVRGTAVIAPHGGGIEAGTSELCLAIAGYTLAGAGSTHPAPVEGVPQRDYWMFEAITSHKDLHVTSTHCDDPAALAVCGNNLYAVSLHGFSPDTGPAKQILIGGRDQRLMRNLGWAFAKHGLTTDTTDPALAVQVVIAGVDSPLNGDDPANIVNRTRTGAGAQLEISTELRRAMFGTFAGAAERRQTAGVGTAHQAHFWNGFVGAVREAVDRHELGLAAPQ
ncbi:poly-gamma-glutamate hydrolase family protein [Streptomyces purpureus]|uniref:poly-gamma-glutamate hydrolase family protein n=1 Tax=Streptomyces purpureus TaxID=1951 RepID=UPI00037F7715|nr:poly-gamma-glutamate hydrolase family protein [Streptomyces purpureus]